VCPVAGVTGDGDNPGPDALLELIDQELRGTPVYAMQEADPTAIEADELQRAADEFADWLFNRDIDPKTATDAEIMAAMADAEKEAAEGRVFEQGADPVAVLTGDEVGTGLTAENVVEQARAYYQSNLQGKSVTRNGVGEVRFSGKGWQKAKRGLRTDIDKARLLPAAPAIIERGTYDGRVAVKDRRDDGIVAFHHFTATVNLNGGNVSVGVSVGEDATGALFYNLNRDPGALLARKKPRRNDRGKALGPPEPTTDVAQSALNVEIVPPRTYDQSDPFDLFGPQVGPVVDTETRKADARQRLQMRADSPLRPGDRKEQADVDGTPLFDAARSPTLFQATRPTAPPRGSVSFMVDGARIIRLFEGSNLSTLLHEGAHVWLEELVADGWADGTPDDVRADLEATFAWFASSADSIAGSCT